MAKVTIIDYGIGNLLSVKRAFEFCDAEVEFADTWEKVEQAERLVLPGVGAFADGMQGLVQQGLRDSILNFAETGRPFLGICLGMQMLLSKSEEFGLHQGLGLISGSVVKMPETGIDGQKHKVPTIGWYGLTSDEDTRWSNTIFQNIRQGDEVYFVHSYMAVPLDESNVLAHYIYNGRRICSAVQNGNIYGCQFHPEKSGTIGLNVIRTFISL